VKFESTIYSHIEQDTQCTCSVKLQRVRINLVATEKQHYILCVLFSYMLVYTV